MIESITFLQDYRCFKMNEQFIFRPTMNVLVGDNGTGKSTLLQLMIDNRRSVVAIKHDGGTTYRYFDFERHNPRVQSWMESASDVLVRLQSHGQVNINILEHLTTFDESVIVIMDEPDVALSTQARRQLITTLRGLTGQIIMTTHDTAIMTAFSEVLSVEHRTWMSSADYLKLLG